MDGIDAAVVDVSSSRGRPRIVCLASVTVSYPRALRGDLERVSADVPVSARELGRISVGVARAFAGAARKATAKARVAVDTIDAVASHGQTVSHRPGRRTLTVQIGEPAEIAESTGVTVVSDFRAADAAAGGQAAPLVPYVHWLLFAHARRTRAIQNVGGMGNVSILPAGAAADEVRGSDTGPGNIVIDECIAKLSSGRSRYDRGGRLAARGTVDDRLVRHVLASPFFRRRLPATTGREDFGPRLAGELVELGRRYRLDAASIVASATMATAESIVATTRRLAACTVDELYVSGGGALNRTLLDMLGRCLPKTRVATTAALGLDPAFVEAQAFAVLGALALAGAPGNLPAVTGARGPRILGNITPGRNYARTQLVHREGGR